MNGAGEFSGLLKTEQVGRLYIVMGSHARGYTLQIFVLPEGELAKPNGPNNACLNADAVEVYGVISGQPGWTESYGWLHIGPWVEDFENLIDNRRADQRKRDDMKKEGEDAKKALEAQRKQALLATYKPASAPCNA